MAPGSSAGKSAAGTMPEVALAVLLRDEIFLDPARRELCSFETLADRLLFWQREALAHDKPTYCLGMNRWKRPAVAAFLGSPSHTPHFLKRQDEAVSLAKINKGRVVAWASTASDNLRRSCSDAGVPLLLMEDGFLRSRGLGSHHVPPLSLVLDERGIYFDPSGPSDIEYLLQNAEISHDLLKKAETFRLRMTASGLSKYNVGDTYRIPLAGKEKVILVPGQVADDASVRLGAGRVNTNWSLLQETRACNPDAYIVYKPHPDVELSRRAGFIPHRELLRVADYIASNMASEAAIEQVDEVWTMTSLLGLEALLRGKKVVCFGLPFFAGWGLTQDSMKCPRRTRIRTLEELVAVTYFLYPKYVDPKTGLRITAQDALELLSSPARQPGLGKWRIRLGL